jgi:ubiquinone/menaquinone biosynthesis C-methylase UbiE
MESSKYSDTEVETRRIYQAQHSKYLNDSVMYERFLRMASDPAYYGLEKRDLQGAVILDAGCGNSGYFQEAMCKHGAKEIHCIDIGDGWIPILQSHLRERFPKMLESLFYFKTGSTTQIPYPDEYFDVVFSNGVLMHLGCVADAEVAMKELARVTKKGGKLFVYSGFDSGIVHNYLVPALRLAYKEVADFRNFIDNLLARDLQDSFRYTIRELRSRRDLSLVSFLALNRACESLFDEDLSRFFQNVLQVPSQQGRDLGSRWLENQFISLGFDQIQFTRSYIHRKNIRKFLAPLHYSKTSGLSKILYGGGHIRGVAQKQ